MPGKCARYDEKRQMLVVRGSEMRLNGKKARKASSMTPCAPIFMFCLINLFFASKNYCYI